MTGRRLATSLSPGGRERFGRVLRLRLGQVAIIGVAAAVIAIIPGLWIAENFLKSSGAPPTSAEQLNFWIRVIAGKWQPDNAIYARTSSLYAFSAGLAVIFNLGVFTAVFAIIVALAKRYRLLISILGELERMMNKTAGLALREHDQKIAVFNLIRKKSPESVKSRGAARHTLSEIDQAFDAGAQNAAADIQKLVPNEEEAAKLIREIEKLYPGVRDRMRR